MINAIFPNPWVYTVLFKVPFIEESLPVNGIIIEFLSEKSTGRKYGATKGIESRVTFSLCLKRGLP